MEEEPWPKIPINSMARRRKGSRRSQQQNPDDFRDVFGGPPRTVLFGRFSVDSEIRSTFYDEIFHLGLVDRRLPASSGGRNLPGFSIPGTLQTKQNFYDDVFGSYSSGDRRRFRYSQSSSVEDMSPLPKEDAMLSSASKLRYSKSKSWSFEDPSPVPKDDTMLSSFASKLRPITIPPRGAGSLSTMSGSGRSTPSTTIPSYPPISCFENFDDRSNSRGSTSRHKFRQQQQGPFVGGSGELSREPFFRRGGSINNPEREYTVYSPLSVMSSIFPNQPPTKSSSSRLSDYNWHSEQLEREMEKVVVQVEAHDDQEEEERGGGTARKGHDFFINIDGIHGNVGETEGMAALDDAIAWAKGKFWNNKSTEFQIGHDSPSDKHCEPAK